MSLAKRWRFMKVDPGESTLTADLTQGLCVQHVLCTGLLGRTDQYPTGNSSRLDPTQGYGIRTQLDGMFPKVLPLGCLGTMLMQVMKILEDAARKKIVQCAQRENMYQK
ncbi:hypothetical protein POM88_045811 [Heracleum sosnowskyi]|uniref:Uncharacterized protein n=1 Tax=Heracleum sosnowskyi TaxID=360622 RepID=A0AAD8M6I9_9APIA|nr:hypothetical protein POM88_045811 [Heracleum sosnowskyi]